MGNMFYRAYAARWLFLACCSLLLSGLLSLSLAFSRMPWWTELFQDPLLIRRILVVHVDLGVSVWFTAFPIAVWFFLNSKFSENEYLSFSKQMRLRASLAIAVVGLLTMVLGGVAGGGTPILANYVPVVDNQFFVAGLFIYLAGVLSAIAGPETFSAFKLRNSQPIFLGALVGVFYLLFAIVGIFIGSLKVQSGLNTLVHYELSMWGGGHLLQFANVTFMLVSWLLVLDNTNVLSVKPRDLLVVFMWLGFPLIIAPFLFVFDITSAEFRESFTYLMKWGIFPPVVFMLFMTIPGVLAKINEQKKNLFSDFRWVGFFISVFLILSGFIFGFLIRGSDLRVPGHYHASIGAVSLAYTVAAILLFVNLGWCSENKIFSSRITKTHVWLYGLGQWLHGFGMVIAGSQGVTRKVYGVEQVIPNDLARMGLGIMGAGSGVAALGGLLFLVIWLKFARRKNLSF